MLALSSAIEPLRSVNRLLGSPHYCWSILGTEKGAISASNGLEIQAGYSLDNPPEADLTIIVASLDLEKYPPKKLLNHVRVLHRKGKNIGAISNGTLFLAQAGVVDSRRVTIHWETLEALNEAYPDVNASAELYCIDKTIFTAGGGASAMDMMLELISSREGRSAAANVAEQFLHGVARPGTDSQRQDLRWRYSLTDSRLEKVVRLMDENQSSPISVTRLAEQVDLSERQLERLFAQSLGKTPSVFYLNLRLMGAHNRLLATTESLEEIAEISGFSSQAHFSRAYKSWHGVSPLSVRKSARSLDVGLMQE